jgi:prepilin-type N-terminal cleavage/methylation domain-containing protein
VKHPELHLPVKGQKGFTLIELVVAISITAVIGSSIMMAISQILSVSITSKNRMVAVKQIENALYYINQDAQMASSITPTGNDFPLVMTWNEWNVAENDLTGPLHQITYSINTENELERVETKGGSSTTRTVAKYISDTSNCSYSANMTTVNLTSSIGGYKPVSETRSMEIKSRPEPLVSSP